MKVRYTLSIEVEEKPEDFGVPEKALWETLKKCYKEDPSAIIEMLTMSDKSKILIENLEINERIELG